RSVTAPATYPPDTRARSITPAAASPPARARGHRALRSGRSRGSGRTARGSRDRTGLPRSDAPSGETWPVDPSLRTGRRIVAAVGRKLQELVGLVCPELGNQGIRVQDGVGELAADPLHLEDVHVLRRVAQVVELDRPARILDRLARLPDRGQEPLAVLDAPLHDLRRLR